VTATGAAPLAYQWRKDNAAIPTTSATTESRLPSQPMQTTRVRDGPCGSVTSVATLTVVSVPAIVSTSLSRSGRAKCRVTISEAELGAAGER
jgi:hypothetical protein